MSDGCGQNLIDSYAYFDRATRSWKTSQACFQFLEDKFSGKSSVTYTRAGTMRNGIVYPQPPLVPRTSGTGSSSSPPAETWLTPNVMDSLPVRSPEALKHQHESNRQGRTTHSTLREQVSCPPPAEMWPTPTVQDAENDAGPSQWERNSDPLNVAVKRWPTPTAQDSTGGGNRNGPNSKAHAGISLTDAALTGDSSTPRSAVSGSLNPTWVEWLMGFPPEWTVLKD